MNDFKLIEEKWQKYWTEHPELYSASNNKDKKKIYVLNEFPYPSGSGLHIGHTFSFTGGDIYARFKRMQGYNVLFPMGWDAFGLPTENYAIKMKRKPQEVTKENTDMFRSQMKRLAFSFDWSREVNTTDPNYYKWTQWIFIQLFKKELAYKKEMPINWCPSCKIGLANEEVIDGKCERCGAEVSRRNISQWVVKITDYADKLIEGLKETEFIDKVKQSQINWIGKSEGARIKFKIAGSRDAPRGVSTEYLNVFTTRPDTLFGATFMVIAPEHELVKKFISEVAISKTKKEEIKDYVVNARKKSEMERTELSKEKTGVFSGLYAINPANNKQIPIWISDFVLVSYGTGAIMSVPSHDERDFAFAKKFGLEIIPVFDDENKAINSDFLNGLDQKEAFKKMINWLEEKGIGERAASYHLRDWVFSRQHYWGEPIPMINCPKCGWVPVPDDQLPIVLPEVKAYEPSDDGKSPLSKIASFVKCKCPVCGGEASRETDTMPNWAGSDWYFLAYCFANKLNEKQASFAVIKESNVDIYSNSQTAFAKATTSQSDIFSNSQKELKYWGPVDLYIGGDEHNVLHLLYSRFIYKFLYDLGVLPKEIKEPYFKRISHGVILGPDNQRMSKSRGNVIVPETVADKYGVDVVRMYLMFMGPFDSTMAWNEKTLMGVKRFLDRFEGYVRSQMSDNDLVRCSTKVSSGPGVNPASIKEVKVIINKLIKGITEDFESFKYNTAIAKMMEALNSLSAIQSISLSNEDIKTLIKLIAPMAPYMAEELYSLFEKTSVHVSSWPVVDERYLVEDTITVAVAVNGKVRSQISVDRPVCRSGKSQVSYKNLILKMAKEDEKIKKWIGDSRIVKEIYVPGKMINIVIK